MIFARKPARRLESRWKNRPRLRHSEIVVRVLRASRIEWSAAARANRSAIKILPHTHLLSASAAKHGDGIKFLLWPADGVVLRDLLMAAMTREPSPAAFELQRDDVVRSVIMHTARFWIDIDAADFDPVDRTSQDIVRSRGQIRTSSDPISQHAIITTKPVLNEPVR